MRVAIVSEDQIDLTDVKEMNFTPEEQDTCRLEYGDILLNEGQSPHLVRRPPPCSETKSRMPASRTPWFISKPPMQICPIRTD